MEVHKVRLLVFQSQMRNGIIVLDTTVTTLCETISLSTIYLMQKRLLVGFQHK